MELIDFSKVLKGKKVLVTGHTGFKGSWLCIWLKLIGAKIVGISLDPKTEKDIFLLSNLSNELKDYRVDIRSFDSINKIIRKEKPEFLFHLAAQPLVIESYKNPRETFETNIMGTINLLEAFRYSKSLKIGVFITTDKCYKNLEKNYCYKESDPMGGHDPYSSSKGACELIIESYRKSFFSKDKSKLISSVRAGNVIGGGDWSENRLVPDIIRSFENNSTLEIRNPNATRPWQHVLEPIRGYLLLACKMHAEKKFDEAWNFGPDKNNNVNVETILKLIRKNLKNLSFKINDRFQLHEANLLSLDIAKVIEKLSWQPILNIEDTIKFTTDWYLSYKTEDIYQLSENQIKQYINLCNLKS